MTLCKASMDDHIKDLLSTYQRQYNDAVATGNYSNLELAMHAKEWIDSEPDLAVLDGPMTPLAIYNELYVPPKMKHGGKRKGAGRKRSMPTKVVRVPEELTHVVERLVTLYKAEDWDNDIERKSIAKYIENTCYLSLKFDSQDSKQF